MNNLYRELAPITDEAGRDREEATRTFKRHIAGRRVVDVSEPGGPGDRGDQHRPPARRRPRRATASSHTCATPAAGRLRVPFTIDAIDIDDVERGSQDSDWDPVKDAAKKLAFAEDRAIFEGYEAASIAGIRKSSSNTALALPADPREIPDVISQALSELRLAGVDGPYCVLLSADVYTQVSETTEHGYPIREHLNRLSTARSSGRPRSMARSCCRPAAATSTCSWAPTCRSATCRTTPTPCSCTCRRR